MRLLELKGQPRIIVVYGGGFQPFHMGHMSSYSQAKEAFPDADFYVAASNDTKTRPIPFDAKKFLAQQAGVVDDFVQVRQPINPQEIMQKYDATRDILVLVRSERDPMSYTKKDGSPGYYQPFVSVEDCEPFDQHGYIFVTKKHTFKVNSQEIYSGSQVREMYAAADEGEQEAIIAQLYPDSDQLDKIKQIFDQYLSQQGLAEGKLIESAVFLNPTTVVVGQAHGQPLELSPNTLKQIQAIAAKHGAWYEGNGTDRGYTKGQIDRYVGSWDDEVAKTASSNDPKWLYVLFANVDENNRVQRVGIDPNDTIFNRLLDTAKDNSFQGIGYTSQALQKFLQMASEGKYDFLKMSQQPATQENLTRFLKAGEALMWPSNWEQYPNKAGKIAKAATVDVRDQYLATRKAGVYVTGSGHLKAVQNITGKQGVAEGMAQDEAEEYSGWRAEFVNQINFNTFEVKMTNTRSKESANFIVRPVDMISHGPSLQIETMDVHDLQTGQTESWTSDDPQPDGGIVYAISGMFYDNKQLQKKLWNIVDNHPGGEDNMPGLQQRRSIGQEVDADAYIDSQEKTQAAMAKMKQGMVESLLDEFAPGPDGFGPFKIYIEEYYTGSSFATFDEAWDEVAFLRASDPKSATHNWRIVDGTGKTVWQYDIGDDIDNMRRGHKIQFIKPDDLKEFVPGGAGGSNSGRWYTDDELADIIGDDWFEDFDVSHDEFNIDTHGEKAKQNLASYANSWFDDRGYNVNVMGVEHNDVDHDLKWYIKGSFHNPRFADEGVAEANINQQVSLWHPETQTYRGAGNKIPTSDYAGDSDITKNYRKVDKFKHSEILPNLNYNVSLGGNDDSIEKVEQNINREKIKKLIHDQFHLLNSREKEIFYHKFWHDMNTADIAQQMSLSTEMVKRTADSALRKLRRSPDVRKLIPYLDSMTESQGDSLKSNALSALMTVKQKIQQDRMAELEKWEQDFKNNVVSKFKSRWPDTKQPSASTPVAQPGEKHSQLKAKLSQLNQAIEKQAMLDKLVQKLDSKGLLSPTIQAGVDTSLLVRDGARDNYVSLNQKLDKALDFVNNRLLTHKAAYAKPKSANMSENMDHSKDDQAVPELKSAMLDKKEKLQNASDDEVYDMIDTLMTRIAKSHGISGQKLHDMWVDKYKEIPDTWIMDENFADGRHPERKGLAKRSGVDTKASVSDLRKTAKNSSGEKARMAHWLANMKAGRAKKSK